MTIFKSKFAKHFVKYRKDESGNSMIEMALVLPFFLVIIFSTIQWSWIFANYAMLDYGHKYATRLIQTGEAHRNAITREDYFQTICDHAVILDCNKLLAWSVEPYKNFSNLGDRFVRGDISYKYDQGNGGEVMLSRVHYRLDTIELLLLGLPQRVFGTTSGNNTYHWIVSTYVFRNEYFR